MYQRFDRADRLVGVGIILLAVGTGLIAASFRSDLPRKRMSTLERNVERSGGLDYTHFGAPSPQVCIDACLSDSRCMSFSFNVDARECWLKRDVPAGVENDSYVSAVKLVR